jgi:hypothetical protein
MTREPKHLLPGYATDSLGEAERRELLRAALDEQELFDALVEQDGLRALLQDPAARQELLLALEQPTAWERVRAWFERPATLLDLAAVAAVVFVGLAGFALLAPEGPSRQPSSAARPMGATLSPPLVAALLELPAREALPAGAEIAGRPDALFAAGETVRVRVTVRAPARVALLHQAPGEPGTQVWPGLGQAPALVAQPGTGGPAILHLSVDGSHAAGRHRLRLVVAPPEVDLGALAAGGLPGAASQLSLVDLSFQVNRP